MADKQIKDLTQVLVNGTSPGDIYMLQIYDSNIGDYVSRKITAADLGACVCSLIGYTLVLDTTNKTIVGAINEVNTAAGDNALAISGLSSAVTSLTSASKYQDTETASLDGVVLPVYDDGSDYYFTIPLSKPILAGLEATLSGDFTIPGILTSDTLASLGTVTVDITPVGLNVAIAPNTYTALTTSFIIGESDALITFSEVQS